MIAFRLPTWSSTKVALMLVNRNYQFLLITLNLWTKYFTDILCMCVVTLLCVSNDNLA